MRNVLLVIAVTALLPASSAAAEQLGRQKSDKSISTRPLPLKGARADDSCAAYGAGFARVDGRQTCVKIGGAVSIGVGGSR
ncbi:MAG: hypothetical protein JWR80_5902 [Bradyrhizobium sp.]|nr:hypothetical protein [Bradyrhizobium sp.]